MTPLELQTANQLGVQPQELPALKDTAAVKRLMADINTKANRVTDAELAAAQPQRPLQIPQPKDVGVLSEAEQREINAQIDAWRKLEREQAEEEELSPALASVPGLKETLRVANAKGIELTEAIPLAETALPPLKKVTYPPPGEEQLRIEPAEEPVQGDAGGILTQTTCQHCGQDLRRHTPEVTDLDKHSYLQECVLGSKRFRKDYPLFGGRMRVVFRTLLAVESDLATRQAEKDFTAQKVYSALGYLERQREYKLVASIDSISRGNNRSTLPELGDFEVEENELSALPTLLTYFNTAVFNTDTIKRAVGQRFAEFENLCNFLELQANNPDFW